MIEPSNFSELWIGLDRLAAFGDFPHLFLALKDEPHRSAGSVEMSIVQLEEKHLEALAIAIEKLAVHEEEVFQDLEYPANSILRLRIATASALIEEILISRESIFGYPGESLREIFPWLLMEWWNAHGRHRAAVKIFLSLR